MPPDDGDVTEQTTISVAGLISGDYAYAEVNGQPLGTANFSLDLDLDEEGGNFISAYVIDRAGNSAGDFITVFRDTTGPVVASYDWPEATRGGSVELSLEFTDEGAGVDIETAPSVTVTLPNGSELNAACDSWSASSAGATWSGHVYVPASCGEGECTVAVSGAVDLLCNEMEEWSASFKHDLTGPGGEDEGEGEDPSGLSVEKTNSYVSPAFVKGSKPADAVAVQWRYAGEGDNAWRDARENDASLFPRSINSGGVCADSWWWTLISLRKPGMEKSEDLDQADRTVDVEFRCLDAAGNASSILSETFTWELVEPGDKHLIQQGDEIILVGDKNGEGQPDPDQVEVGITRTVGAGEYTPMGFSAAYQSAEKPNRIASFPEGQYLAETDFHYTTCGGRKAQQQTKIYVIKRLLVRTVAGSNAPAFPTTVWEEFTTLLDVLKNSLNLENSDLWSDDNQGNRYVLLSVPATSACTTWANYSLINGSKADVPGWAAAWITIAGNNPQLLWWSGRLKDDADNELTIRVEVNGAVLDHDSKRRIVNNAIENGFVDLIADYNKDGIVDDHIFAPLAYAQQDLGFGLMETDNALENEPGNSVLVHTKWSNRIKAWVDINTHDKAKFHWTPSGGNPANARCEIRIFDTESKEVPLDTLIDWCKPPFKVIGNGFQKEFNVHVYGDNGVSGELTLLTEDNPHNDSIHFTVVSGAMGTLPLMPPDGCDWWFSAKGTQVHIILAGVEYFFARYTCTKCWRIGHVNYKDSASNITLITKDLLVVPSGIGSGKGISLGLGVSGGATYSVGYATLRKFPNMNCISASFSLDLDLLIGTLGLSQGVNEPVMPTGGWGYGGVGAALTGHMSDMKIDSLGKDMVETSMVLNERRILAEYKDKPYSLIRQEVISEEPEVIDTPADFHPAVWP